MRKLIITLSIFFTISTVTDAKQSGPMLEGIISKIVLADEFPFDEEQICVTFLESKQGIVGVIEDIRQCFFARNLKGKIGDFIEINEKNNFIVQDESLIETLGQYTPNVQYIIIDFE